MPDGNKSCCLLPRNRGRSRFSPSRFTEDRGRGGLSSESRTLGVFGRRDEQLREFSGRTSGHKSSNNTPKTQRDSMYSWAPEQEYYLV
ncbi:hypothetical protein AOLI_G00189990 [Acnodon oligacanthus]